MFGLHLTIDRYLCVMQFVRFRKNHRKARINKKWHKKYGAILECRNDKFYRIGDTLISCPCIIAMIRKEIDRASSPVPVSSFVL